MRVHALCECVYVRVHAVCVCVYVSSCSVCVCMCVRRVSQCCNSLPLHHASFYHLIRASFILWLLASYGDTLYSPLFASVTSHGIPTTLALTMTVSVPPVPPVPSLTSCMPLTLQEVAQCIFWVKSLCTNVYVCACMCVNLSPFPTGWCPPVLYRWGSRFGSVFVC